MSRVLVLGAGFDALLAAHAASVLGHDVRIVAAHTNLEDLTGAQLLLAPIPMIETKTFPLRYLTKDDPSDVLHKLLNQGGVGRGPEGLDKPELDGRMIWDSGAVYTWLRETYADHVTPIDSFKGTAIEDLFTVLKPDHVFSGLDARTFCRQPQEHMFSVSTIVNMLARERSDFAPNFIEFSGDPDDSWAVESYLFGEAWRTYGSHRHPPVSAFKLFPSDIPQLSNCTCAEEMDVDILQIGKMGTWSSRWPRHRSFYLPFHILDNG